MIETNIAFNIATTLYYCHTLCVKTYIMLVLDIGLFSLLRFDQAGQVFRGSRFTNLGGLIPDQPEVEPRDGCEEKTVGQEAAGVFQKRSEL